MRVLAYGILLGLALLERELEGEVVRALRMRMDQVPDFGLSSIGGAAGVSLRPARIGDSSPPAEPTPGSVSPRDVDLEVGGLAPAAAPASTLPRSRTASGSGPERKLLPLEIAPAEFRDGGVGAGLELSPPRPLG